MLPDDYKVELDVFEGPLDLLLYLIRKNEVEIYNIPVETITTQYMQYLGMMQMLDLNIAGEFLVMAATLMMIKSRMLLPAEERAPEEEEEEGADPRWDLVRQLVEYKKFKDAAAFLEDLERRRENVFAREGDGVQLGRRPEVPLQDVSLFDLIAAFNEVLSRAPEESLAEIMADTHTVAEKIDDLVRRLGRRERVSLHELFRRMTHRAEMICTFLAVLELIKLKQVLARQDGPFGEIVLARPDDWSRDAEAVHAGEGGA